MAYEEVKEYLTRIPSNPITSLESTELDKVIYQAEEELKSFYHIRHITFRAIVLQAIYNKEASLSEYESLRRQGIKSLSTKRGSIAFADSDSSIKSSLAPQVIDLLGAPASNVGRLY